MHLYAWVFLSNGVWVTLKKIFFISAAVSDGNG